MTVNFNNLMNDIKEKYDINYRDVAGTYSKERMLEADRLKKEWAVNNGFDPDTYDILVEKGWFKDGGEAYLDEVPYLDVWHYMLNNDIDEIENGGTFDLNLSMERIFGSEPEYVRIVLALIRKELEPIKDDEVEFYISW